jgi:hypothetical protein
MIDSYSAQRSARIEHELMNQSLIKVSDYEVPLTHDQPDWVSRQTVRLLAVIGNSLQSVGEHMRRERGTALVVSLKDRPENSMPG